ncbi:MAG: Asp23/Gls24 family envelope stress response protein [Coriobacteriaceae bacterium]|nr:Asp23/Gls24 family envelope stress response protein [Coriobacteriaceae bacterium]
MPQTVPGGLSVADEVIVDMIGYAALESYGVVGMASPSLADGIAKRLPANRLRKGIEVDITDRGIHADLYIIAEQGTNLTEVSRNLADRVAFVLKDSAQLQVDGIEVHIQGINVSN